MRWWLVGRVDERAEDRWERTGGRTRGLTGWTCGQPRSCDQLDGFWVGVGVTDGQPVGGRAVGWLAGAAAGGSGSAMYRWQLLSEPGATARAKKECRILVICR